LVARKGGAGGVARSRSTFIGAWSKPYEGITNPLIAEALVVRDGVIFAQLRGYSKVVLETDCLEVISLWNNRHDSRSVVAPILQEVGELVISFNSFIFQHVFRLANNAAHLCAKLACTLTVSSSWLDCIPNFLLVSIQTDQSGLVLIEIKLSKLHAKKKTLSLRVWPIHECNRCEIIPIGKLA
jgi:hypothetical protein